MEKFEDFFLDRFIPWFTYISTFVGILTIFFIICNEIQIFFGLAWSFTLPVLIVCSGTMYLTVKENRIKRKK